MPDNKNYLKVPRGRSVPGTFAYQSDTMPPQLNSWLREDPRDMAWHNLDSVLMPPTSVSSSNTASNGQSKGGRK